MCFHKSYTILSFLTFLILVFINIQCLDPFIYLGVEIMIFCLCHFFFISCVKEKLPLIYHLIISGTVNIEEAGYCLALFLQAFEIISWFLCICQYWPVINLLLLGTHELNILDVFPCTAVFLYTDVKCSIFDQRETLKFWSWVLLTMHLKLCYIPDFLCNYISKSHLVYLQPRLWISYIFKKL